MEYLVAHYRGLILSTSDLIFFFLSFLFFSRYNGNLSNVFI